jgi:hypothetical protein
VGGAAERSSHVSSSNRLIVPDRLECRKLLNHIVKLGPAKKRTKHRYWSEASSGGDSRLDESAHSWTALMSVTVSDRFVFHSTSRAAVGHMINH